ncbi:hypothetical protein MCOR32_006112 [Pyricularia oryzae]|nr:hypothetical protein MCOR32_006112 [Pyricularia oryzae]
MRVISLSTLNSPPLDSDSEPEHDINNTTLLFGPKAARLALAAAQTYEGPTNFLGWGSLRSPAPSYGDRHTYTHIEWGDAEERRLNVRFWRFVGGMVVVVTAACIVAIVFGHYLRGSI